MQSQNVLVIPASVPNVAGFSPLPNIHQEIQVIQKYHNTEVLAEPVRRIDLLRRSTKDTPVDILHFAGHLSADGFISGNEIIPIQTLVMCIVTVDPSLVVFATCSSERVAEMVASQCSSDCLYTIDGIADEDASNFSILFYSVLLNDHVTTYFEAHQRVDPTGSLFRYLEGKDLIIRRGDQTAARLAAIEKVLAGELGSFGLVQRVALLEAELKELKPRLTDTTPTIKPNTMFIVILITIALLILILLWRP